MMTDNLIGMGLSDNILEPDEKAAQQMQQELASLQKRLAELPEVSDELTRERLQLDIATLLVAMEQKKEAWDIARPLFDSFVAMAAWQDAVKTSDVLYATDQDDSIIALGNGVWLAVTFPVDPTLSVNMLDHIIEETPAESDGGAVAAATAHYLAELRASDDKQREGLSFLTGNLLAGVAYQHSGYKEREMIDMWVERLELNQPDKFLPRLGIVLDIIVGDKWWVDRDALRGGLPEDADSYSE
ncbi:hypothetical protein BMS3Bbin11_00697 [bacterium BMS3Bbin11]|nr:hypothetical protein BMS3Bbin11_00697 [bacterium BMS3Bbin11]HDH08710.1 hypothetical protein [Gammaproteobacteria bacterium]